MDARDLKRNVWYVVIDPEHHTFKENAVVKRGKWVGERYEDGTKFIPQYDDEVSVAFYQKGTKRVVWNYLRPDQVKEL